MKMDDVSIKRNMLLLCFKSCDADCCFRCHH